MHGLADLAPDRPVRCTVHKADGTTVEFESTHTFSPEQIEWFKAGSALNIIRARALRSRSTPAYRPTTPRGSTTSRDTFRIVRRQ